MKSKNDIRYNGSGYYDETAFKAIKNTDRGRIHNMKKSKTVRGDIWEMETSQTGQIKEVLLVQCFKDYAAVLTLAAEKPIENGMSIKSKALMWIDCGRLVYVFYDKLIQPVRTLSDKELEEVLYRIGASLDLPSDEPINPDQLGALPEKTATQTKSVREPDQEMVQMLADSALALEGMTRERDIYKQQYEKILNVFLQKLDAPNFS